MPTMPKDPVAIPMMDKTKAAPRMIPPQMR